MTKIQMSESAAEIAGQHNAFFISDAILALIPQENKS